VLLRGCWRMIMAFMASRAPSCPPGWHQLGCGLHFTERLDWLHTCHVPMHAAMAPPPGGEGGVQIGEWSHAVNRRPLRAVSVLGAVGVHARDTCLHPSAHLSTP
jgi:hypothetical protein